MKLLVLASSGGDAHRRALHDLVSSARERDDVRVLAPDAEGKVLRALGVPIESWKPAGLFNVLRSTGALRRAVELQVPDVIHAVGWTAAAVALGALPSAYATRTLVTVFDPIHDAEMPKAFVEKRLPELLQRAGYTTTGYPTLARDLVARFGVAPGRIEALAPGTVPALDQPAPRRTGRDGPVLGALGGLDGGKSWEHLIDALVLIKRRYPDARLEFVPNGLPRNLVRSYARGRGVHHEVTLFDDAPPRAWMAGIDLVVVPRGRDGLPYALLQALVDGVPAIGANDFGIADTLGSYETGWLVPDGPEGITAGVLDAWPQIDEAWAGAQAQRGRAIAAYDPAAVAARLDAIRCELALAGGEDAHPPLAEQTE